MTDSDPYYYSNILEMLEKDSGMSSLGGSKDETPERRAIIVSFVKFIYFIRLINENNLVNYSKPKNI